MPTADQDERGGHHLAEAEMVHEGGGKRPEQAEEHQPHREGRRDLLGGPAELFLSGWIRTPAEPIAPAVASITRNVVPATIQP